MSDGQYVCTVCTMKHEVCGGEGGCTIGQASTNQKRRERYSVIIANANGGSINMGEEGTKVSGTFATSSSNFGNFRNNFGNFRDKIIKPNGGGTKMKIPAIYL